MNMKKSKVKKRFLKVLPILFPFIYLFRLRDKKERKDISDGFKDMGNVILENLSWTLKIYSLTLALPLAMIVSYTLICGVMGVDMGGPFSFSIIGEILKSYFYSGEIVEGVRMWRIHILLLILSFIFQRNF